MVGIGTEEEKLSLVLLQSLVTFFILVEKGFEVVRTQLMW